MELHFDPFPAATWHTTGAWRAEAETVRLEAEAKDHDEMAEIYRKNPNPMAVKHPEAIGEGHCHEMARRTARPPRRGSWRRCTSNWRQRLSGSSRDEKKSKARQPFGRMMAVRTIQRPRPATEVQNNDLDKSSTTSTKPKKGNTDEDKTDSRKHHCVSHILHDAYGGSNANAGDYTREEQAN